MGATSGCCSGAHSDAAFTDEAKTNTQLNLAHKATEYQQMEPIKLKDRESEEAIAMKTDTATRGSLVNIDPPNKQNELIESKQTESESVVYKNDDECKDVKLRDEGSRHSYEEDIKLETITELSENKAAKKAKKTRKRKHRNKLISPLKECIKEFNQKAEDHMLDIIGAKHVSSASIHTEHLGASEICKHFKVNKYDIAWFLSGPTPREKFIIIIVNQWNDISILTAITLYDALNMKIHKTMKSVTRSELDLFDISGSTRNGKKAPVENMEFRWKESTKNIKQCDVNQFVYIVSIIVKNENIEIMKNNNKFKKSMVGEYKPLFAQKEILSYLMEIKMNGYLFKGITKDIFYTNIGKLVVDQNVQENEGFSEQYITDLYQKINVFDVTQIKANQKYTIEFEGNNSKRWESVTSLFKNMQISEYSVDLFDDDDTEEYSESTSNMRGIHDDIGMDTITNHNNDETNSKHYTLQDPKEISKQMMELQKEKDTMDTSQYIQKMEILQQKLRDSLHNSISDHI